MSEKELLLLLMEKVIIMNEQIIRDTDQGCRFYDSLLGDIWEIYFKIKQGEG